MDLLLFYTFIIVFLKQKVQCTWDAQQNEHKVQSSRHEEIGLSKVSLMVGLWQRTTGAWIKCSPNLDHKIVLGRL
jgi:hypothetical protein